MAKYYQRTKGGSIYLVWNHTRGYSQVGTTVLRPHDGSSPSSRPTAKAGISLLFTGGSHIQSAVADMLDKGLISAVEVLTDDVLSIPFPANRYGVRLVTGADLRGAAPATPAPAPEPEPVVAESTPLSSPNVFEVAFQETEEAPVEEPPVEEPPAEEETTEEVVTSEEEESGEELPWIAIADQELYDAIPWDDLGEEKRDDLREWGKAFEPPINGISKAAIIEAMMDAKSFLEGE